jgi:cytochrome b6-f complex iron-sulfur subunit
MSTVFDFLKALAGICRTRPLESDHWNVDGSRITVSVGDVPELRQVGGAVYLKGQGLPVPVLIVRTQDDGYLCVENRCTHMGRRLDPEPDGKTLRCCSVSHSMFDYQGNKLEGPAKGSIQLYHSQEEDGRLLIWKDNT